ncbi:Crp/Fnr family transcriptional regulator [Ramlibacter sp. RBP-2]|uniref:Crp/Fnr family transcriptional regulator n=1 Tax=Ramlibacter lithotrophicus TaxID=2606681 RepID=A0A7X6I709_9BURK|nr:Crp/Fnr family transcriptional regulator [Ramlibacter lithotrophicus]NKE66684.1 Crp/Fnr family transcriptional regulator [Ramlibacter lithotrophicus]
MPFVPLPGALRERALAKLLPQNGVLAALPEDVQARLLPHLALVDLPAGQQLGQPSGNFARAYFPVAGVVSLIQGTAGGERVSAMVGSEGVVGLPKFMSDPSVIRVAVQSAGYGLALGREQLLEEWARGGTFMRLLMRYNRALAAQKVVLNACRGLHSLDQQLGTLLLMSLDRLGGQEVVLPQDSAAQLLGVPAQELGAAVDRLCQCGAASWRRPGVFAAQDGAALRAVACGCERRVASEYQRLLADGPPPSAPSSAGGAAADASRRVARDAMVARGGSDRPHGG